MKPTRIFISARHPFLISLYQLYSGDGQRLYESGEMDITGIGSYDAIASWTQPSHCTNELLTGVNLCTGYVVFDTTQPPFDDVNVRKAFSMAFDRQKYIDVVLSGHALPANGSVSARPAGLQLRSSKDCLTIPHRHANCSSNPNTADRKDCLPSSSPTPALAVISAPM